VSIAAPGTDRQRRQQNPTVHTASKARTSTNGLWQAILYCGFRGVLEISNNLATYGSHRPSAIGHRQGQAGQPPSHPQQRKLGSEAPHAAAAQGKPRRQVPPLPLSPPLLSPHPFSLPTPSLSPRTIPELSWPRPTMKSTATMHLTWCHRNDEPTIRK
jgi:hypothetical protein